MARINIDDSFWTDHRLQQLTFKLGNHDMAIGCTIRAIRLAQEYYLKSDNNMIPIKEWKSQGLPDELFQVGFAEMVDDFVLIAKAHEYFGWLKQKSEAGKVLSDKKLEALKNARKKRWEESPLTGSETALKNSERNLNDSERTLNPFRENTAKTLNGSERALNGSEPQSQYQSQSQFQSQSQSQLKIDKPRTAGKPTDLGPHPALVGQPGVNEMLFSLKKQLQENWITLYGDKEWIKAELFKAWNYYYVLNPQKQPKSPRGLSTTLNRWLDRAWGWRSKSQPGQSSNESKGTFAQQRANNLKRMGDKYGIE